MTLRELSCNTVNIVLVGCLRTDIEASSEASASRPTSRSRSRHELHIRVPHSPIDVTLNPASTPRDSSLAQMTPLPSGSIARPPPRSLLEPPAPVATPRDVTSFDDVTRASPYSTHSGFSGGGGGELYPLQLLTATKPLYDEGLV